MMSGLGSGPESVPGGRSDPILHLVVANDFGDLCRALETVDEFLEGHGVDGEAVYTVRLAAEEIVTNIIKYAYDDAGTHEISIDLRLSPGSVVLRMADDGKAFDPLAAPAPVLDVPLEEKEVGGVGIHLVRTMAERLEYARVGGKNVLSATIRREPKG